MRRELALWLLIGVIGFALFLGFYARAFPEANLDLRTSRADALQFGEAALKQLGSPDFSGYRSAVAFDWDETSKRYLEKTLGLQRADAAMREVGVWYWYCRWVLTGSRDEYTALVSPEGSVILVRWELPEERPDAALPEAQARAVGERFLQTRLRLDLRQWRLVDRRQFQRPKRRDYHFTYEHRRKRFPPTATEPATVRLTVDIAGKRVVGYWLRWLRVPEKWRFEERRRQTQRSVLMGVAQAAYGVLWLALLILGIRALARREAFAGTMARSISAAAAFVTLITALNFAPLWWLRYDPSQPEATFIADRLMSALVSVLSVGIQVALLAMLSEWVSRDAPPAGVPLSAMVRPAFWGAQETARALGVGFCLGFAHLGYVVAFYLLGRAVGVWTPLDVPYTNAVATPFPWLEPLFHGLLPALREELFFRVAAIYLLWRWTKRWWVAALLAGVVWAFLHTGYPPEPAFTRGLELLPIALTFAWAAFRYGVVASMAAHYTYNAMLTALLFVRAEEPYLRWSGVLVGVGVLWLFAPALVTWRRRGRLPSVHELPPVSPVAPPLPVAVETPLARYQPIARRTWLALIALALVGAGVRVLYRREVFRVLPMMTCNREEARQVAADYLRRRGVAVQRYGSAVDFETDLEGEGADYVIEKAGRKTLHRLWREQILCAYWWVRFFRPLEREEWRVYLHPDGRVMTFSRKLPEEASGAQLSRDEARRKAETYLRMERGIKLEEWRLSEADQQVRPRRIDHWFTYEHRTLRIGDAPLRMRVRVQGDEPQGWWVWLQVPEAWSFQREQFAAWTRLAWIWLLLLALGVGIYVLLMDWREGTVGADWRFGWKVAALVTPFVFLLFVNHAESFKVAYPTTLPPVAYMATSALVIIVGLGVDALLVAVAFGSLAHALRVRLPELVPLPAWLNRRAWESYPADAPLRHPMAWRDGVLVGYLLSVAALVATAFDEHASVLTGRLPALDYLGGIVLVTVALLWLGAGWASTYHRYIRTPLRLTLLLVLCLPLGMMDTHSPKEALKETAQLAAALSIGSVFLFWLTRRALGYNLWGWAMSVCLPALLVTAVEFWQSPDGFLRAQAILLFAIYLLPAVAVLRRVSSRSRMPSDEANCKMG